MEGAYIPEPTVHNFTAFDAKQDAVALHKAFEGFGTNEQAIINILPHRSNCQRQEISSCYTHEYTRDLIADLKRELRGDLEGIIVGLMYPPMEYLARQLHTAMAGLGTNESAIIEILCSCSKQEIKEISKIYEALYKRELATEIKSETSGHFRQLLVFLLSGASDDSYYNPSKALHDAEQLFLAGEGQWGSEEHVFNRILTHNSRPQLKLIFEQYKQVSGGSCIEEALCNEFSGDLLEGLLSVVENVQDKSLYFAKKLHKAMEGLGTDDTTLMRIIISRSEIDLGNIKKMFEKIYDKSLESAVKSETSGNYKRVLLSVICG